MGFSGALVFTLNLAPLELVVINHECVFMIVSEITESERHLVAFASVCDKAWNPLAALESKYRLCSDESAIN